MKVEKEFPLMNFSLRRLPLFILIKTRKQTIEMNLRKKGHGIFFSRFGVFISKKKNHINICTLLLTKHPYTKGFPRQNVVETILFRRNSKTHFGRPATRRRPLGEREVNPSARSLG
ncbi:hypothetical protein O6U65_1745 [Saccharomyces cerevisiae synthetic construct]|uniref:Putative uncharacterized protein YLR184W n=1 Tax=Saccharomyces cerevisiae (strain ATCC 204508 / S288c) TaxID=559292 RepID=YL184_YEAST|nr:RecName: Full=Putative uncharacterized protein YLR184W [Saccharomyces cerevisiae S288C]AAB67459.1 Ylr184wp [Saccharomyces cerevisiae]WNV72885.1 hypothetical protein O6U65_1745 [Saccharomyces cerevisiae synthetic construct]